MDKHSEQGNKHAFVWNKEQLDSVDAANTDYLLGTFIHHVTAMIAMSCVCISFKLHHKKEFSDAVTTVTFKIPGV